jgi:hypothetical protein
MRLVGMALIAATVRFQGILAAYAAIAAALNRL